jgi:hypothetical protein
MMYKRIVDLLIGEQGDPPAWDNSNRKPSKKPWTPQEIEKTTMARGKSRKELDAIAAQNKIASSKATKARSELIKATAARKNNNQS